MSGARFSARPWCAWWKTSCRCCCRRLIGTSGNFETIVFGIVLVVVLKYAPDGLWSFVGRWLPAPPRRADWGGAAPLPRRAKPARGERLLDVQAVRKQFGGLVAVNDVSFSLHSGDIVALIGPNGAGKSTLFNLVTGVLPLSGGAVQWRGQSIGGKTFARHRAAGHLAHLPAREDDSRDDGAGERGAGRLRPHASPACCRRCCGWTAPRNAQLFAEAEAQLARIGITERLDELAGNLALGPQRLMEIARALATDPALLLLDEPAAGLRHHEKQALAEVLRQLKDEGMSLLLVEHDMDFVMGLADRVVVMEFGTKLIEGTPAEVQASPAVRAAYLGTEH